MGFGGRRSSEEAAIGFRPLVLGTYHLFDILHEQASHVLIERFDKVPLLQLPICTTSGGGFERARTSRTLAQLVHESLRVPYFFGEVALQFFVYPNVSCQYRWKPQAEGALFFSNSSARFLCCVTLFSNCFCSSRIRASFAFDCARRSCRCSSAWSRVISSAMAPRFTGRRSDLV